MLPGASAVVPAFEVPAAAPQVLHHFHRTTRQLLRQHDERWLIQFRKPYPAQWWSQCRRAYHQIGRVATAWERVDERQLLVRVVHDERGQVRPSYCRRVLLRCCFRHDELNQTPGNIRQQTQHVAFVDPNTGPRGTPGRSQCSSRRTKNTTATTAYR